LPEPVARARALAAAADCLRRRGDARAGTLCADAAGIYAAVGADRSLAQLLRGGGRSRALAAYHVPAGQARAGAVGLTPREQDVADLARQGFTLPEIADRLGISYGTARNHLARVRAKLGGVRKSDLTRLLSDG
ncbi:MAG TPA: LuxR C-terminal-related transcriptional regulator, partial [Frankiaceae bacterium]|nr:LuxR C-terminal-related transcriptional regulator [Frankiaceae bacterium]